MIKSLEHAIDILHEIARRKTWVGVREIARAQRLKPPTAQHLLKTMQAKGLLEFDAERRQYRLGVGLWLLAENINPLDGLANLIDPYIEEIFRQFGETVVALARIDNMVQAVRWRQSNHSLAVIAPNERGGIAAPHYLAGGRVVLAFSGRLFQESYVNKMCFPEKGKNLFNSAREFNAALEEIRKQGYAVTENILDSGIGALAAPIFYANGDFALALSSSLPLSRFRTVKKDKILHTLRKISATIRLDSQRDKT